MSAGEVRFAVPISQPSVALSQRGYFKSQREVTTEEETMVVFLISNNELADAAVNNLK